MKESRLCINMRLFSVNRLTILHLLVYFLLTANDPKCQVPYQDSLRNIIATSSSNEQKLKAWIMLGSERNSLHADSLKLYATETKKLAIILNNKEALLEALLMQGHVWNKQGETAKAIELAEAEILKEYPNPGLRHTQRKFYLLKGFVLNVINRPTEAQATFFNVLVKAESEGDLYIQAAAENGIAWSYQNLNNAAKAIDWYKKGIEVLRTANQNIRLHNDLMTVLHSNTGLAYYQFYKNSGNKKFADSANSYFDSAIYTCRQKGFLGVLAISLGTKSLLINKGPGKNLQSAQMLSEAIQIRKKLGQLYFFIADMSKLSEIYYQSHNYKKSISICLEAIRLADSSGIKSDIIYLYEILAKYLNADGQYKQYGDALAMQIRIQDSIYKANTISSLNELTVKYEVQKQDALITKQKYNLLRRNVLIYVIIFCGIAILLIVFVEFRRLKKRQRFELAVIKEEEEHKIEEERKQAREIERERITADLHDDIGASLSSMNIYSDLAGNFLDTKPDESRKLVHKISGTAKELMERMGDIIWSMKPADEEKYTLEARLKNYSNELLSPKDIECEFNIDATLAASITNPERKKNILLIAKEAINNAAKYSQAKKVIVMLNATEEHIILKIQDNGVGIERESIPGNGLNNMKNRCVQSGGIFKFVTEKNNGICIECVFPIAENRY